MKRPFWKRGAAEAPVRGDYVGPSLKITADGVSHTYICLPESTWRRMLRAMKLQALVQLPLAAAVALHAFEGLLQ